MKKTALKLCCLMTAASVLLASCNTPTPSESSTKGQDTIASTTISTTESTHGSTNVTTVQTPATETTTDTQPIETTTATMTDPYLPTVDPTKYTDAQMSEEELYDKMMGGWLGQMIGVAWTASTEFGSAGAIRPASKFPVWKPEMVSNAYEQDDVYVEIPFLDAMKAHGAQNGVS